MASSEATSNDCNHLEDIIIIWLDETITTPEELLLSQRKTLLLSYIKSIQPFTDPSECREFIEKLNNVRIFFVVSGTLGEKIIPVIHDLPQLFYVYIFCAANSSHEVWPRQFNKIRGAFDDEMPLSIQIKDDVCSLSDVIFPFGLFDSTDQSLQDLTIQQASFMWFQLVVQVLLRLPQTPEAKAEMIAECRVSYADNKPQLENIALFEKEYQASEAIKWYTDNAFVFQLFNKAFRKQDFEIIFKYRFFLVDLFNQLSSLYNQQYKNREGFLTVYRGQLMFKDELMKLKQNIGHLISINTFFSTAKTSTIATKFCGNGEHESMGIVSVVFEIEIDLMIPCRPFASIANLSSIKDEREILFSIGTIFRIESVDLVTDTIWFVKLTWTKDCDEKLKEMKQLTDLLNFYTSQNIGDHPSTLTFGLFLSKMGLLHQANRFYMYLLKILPLDHPDRGVLHNNLGEVLRRLNYFNRARFQFEMALEYCTDTMSIFHPIWAIIHSNIALLDVTCERPKQALKGYNCALLILTRINNLNDGQTLYIQEALATVYHGMGSAYYLLSQFQKAFELHQKALHMELHLLPCDHPTLVDSYNRLGLVNMNLRKWIKALENFEEALRIAEVNLLIGDWRFIDVHVNVAILVYIVNKNVSKTLLHCSRALQIMNQSKFPLVSSNRLQIYKTLACLYTSINLGHLAFQMWEQLIKAATEQLIANADTVNFSDLMKEIDMLQTPKQKSNQDSKYMILMANDKCLSSPQLRQSEMVNRCEIADQWRAMGYIRHAICYYTWLIERLSMLDDPEFVKLHKSRLHNNLAACYQDLDDDQTALYHYRLSLDILSSDEEHKSMQAAIIHYNIALIHKNCNEIDEAQKHLHKSLSHFSGLSDNQNSTLDVKIYIAFAKLYEQSNEWKMAREYYERVLDQLKQDIPDNPIIAKFEKRLQYIIDKINDST